jgi:hypothetical protein
MPGPESSTRVKLLDQQHGKLVPIGAKMLREAGIDPDAKVEANRYVFDSDSGRSEIRLRLYEVEDDDDDVVDDTADS